jgi:hypothetical protein
MKKPVAHKKLVLRRESLRVIQTLLGQVRAGVRQVDQPDPGPHTHVTNEVDGGDCVGPVANVGF